MLTLSFSRRLGASWIVMCFEGLKVTQQDEFFGIAAKLYPKKHVTS